MKKYIISIIAIWSLVLLSLGSVLGQNYISLNDYSGISLSAYSDALNDTASTILEVFPDNEYEGELEVYESNHYVHSTKFEESLEDQFNSYIDSRTDLTKYYIFIGRFHYDDGSVEILTNSNFPIDGVYSCLDQIRNTIDGSAEAIIKESIGNDNSISNIATSIGLGIRSYRIQLNHYLNCECALKSTTCEIGYDFINTKLLGLGWSKKEITLGSSYEDEPSGNVIDFAQTELVRNGNTIKIPDEVAISKQIMDEQISLGTNLTAGFVIILNNESFGIYGNEWEQFLATTLQTNISYVVGHAIITNGEKSYLYTKNHFPSLQPPTETKPGSRGDGSEIENRSGLTGNIFWDAVNQVGKPVAIDFFFQVLGNRFMVPEILSSDSPWSDAVDASSVLDALGNVAQDKLESLLFWKSDNNKFDLETEVGKVIFKSFAKVIRNALNDIENYTVQKGLEDFLTEAGVQIINMLERVPFIENLVDDLSLRRLAIVAGIQYVASELLHNGYDNLFTDILIQGSLDVAFAAVLDEISIGLVKAWKIVVSNTTIREYFDNLNSIAQYLFKNPNEDALLKSLFEDATGKEEDFIHTVDKLSKDLNHALLDGTYLGLDDATIDAKNWLKEEPGWYDVIVHGTPDEFKLNTGDDNWVSLNHVELAEYMIADGYTGGKVRLVSCQTGVYPDAIGQHLANKLDVEVIAPKGYITVFVDGSYTIHTDSENIDGSAILDGWRTFISGTIP